MKAAAEPAAGFSADWLQQREPFDALARQTAARGLRLAARMAPSRPRDGAPLRVIDLACGTGANLRWLAPRLGGEQEWLVVDHDAALLQSWPAALAGRTLAPAHQAELRGAVAADAACGSDSPPLDFSGPGFQAAIVRRRLDLAQSLESLPWQAAHWVSASALLDLVSASWLQRLVAVATGARLGLLMALSVDGRHQWTPGDEGDAAVATLFGAHQQRDKGFGGPALGAAAAPALACALRAAGYRVHSARSDWVLDGGLGGAALALQRAMVDGLAAAALEQAPTDSALLRGWQQRRQALAPHSVLRVGHLDLLALPPA